MARTNLPRGARYPQSGGWFSFAGGLNNRDAPPELGPADVVQAYNVTFDERGGVATRLGYSLFDSGNEVSANAKQLYWSPLLNSSIRQYGANLYLGSNATIRKTFTTSAKAVFAELAGKVYAGHPVDGLFSSTDGITWTAVADVDKPATVVALAVWQNKLWAALGGATNPSRLQWSDPGDGTAWTANSWVDLREKDNEPLVALHIGSGQDILGRPGLFAFKQESGYRVHDSSTGAFETVDATVGCANSSAVVGVGPYVYTLGRRGIFRWQAGKLGALNMSSKLLPLWDPTQIDLTQTALWCAGRRRNRALFSLTRLGSTANDLAIELHTEQGWLATGSNAMAAYMTSQGTEENTYGSHPVTGVTTVSPRIYKLYDGATDNGTQFSWTLQTRWLDLLGGYKAMVLRLMLRGRGAATLTVLRDYLTAGDAQAISFDTSAASLYDTGLHYDTGLTYFTPTLEGTIPVFGIGAARQLSLLFSGGSGTSTRNAEKIAQPAGGGTIAGPQVGAFALFLGEALYSRLGTA